MKVFLLVTMAFISFYETAFSQCPEPGLKIQSAACEEPKNLQVIAVTCSTLKVKWSGNKQQQYIVKATCTDLLTDQSYEGKVSQISCDDKGSCGVAILVKEGTVINWSVQAVCSMEGAALYSAELSGENARMLKCLNTEEITGPNAIRVFPNPANDYLVVQYSGSSGSSTSFKVYDITGKKMLSRLGAPSAPNNQYRLDLHKLQPGTYLLESVNDGHVNKTKFILLRN